MKKQKGFTLVELMIVVAIIGILAAIAIPKFADMLEKSRDGATKGNISAIKSAVSIYYGDQQGAWPSDLENNGATNPLTFLPKYIAAIPPVKSTGANTSNSSTNIGKGPGKNSAFAKYIGYGTFAAITTTGDGWVYDNAAGSVWVNSTVLDMSGKSFTMFGAE